MHCGRCPFYLDTGETLHVITPLPTYLGTRHITTITSLLSAMCQLARELPTSGTGLHGGSKGPRQPLLRSRCTLEHRCTASAAKSLPRAALRVVQGALAHVCVTFFSCGLHTKTHFTICTICLKRHQPCAELQFILNGIHNLPTNQRQSSTMTLTVKVVLPHGMMLRDVNKHHLSPPRRSTTCKCSVVMCNFNVVYSSEVS